MGKFIDLTGKKFGKLTVLRRDFNGRKQVYWLCQCDCGTIKSIRSGHLCGGKIVSCGCHAIFASSLAKIKRNKIEVCNDFAKVYLFGCDKYAVIDIEDIDKVKNFCWSLSYYGYAVTHLDIKDKTSMHRIIMGVENPKQVVDHINHDKLDNRKKNLRLFDSNTNNLHNLDPRKAKSNTGFLNIYLTKSKKYSVSYTRYRKKYNVGFFETIEEAKEALKRSIKENGFTHGAF